MHPGLDLALPCYKLEMEQHAQGIHYQTTPFRGQLHLQAKVSPVQNKNTVTLKERHWAYCMVLKDFYHYCFAREVSIITNHTPLVAMFKKDVATLLQRIQCILLRIHQFQLRILYKPGPELVPTDWLSRHNHTENRDAEIHGIDIKVDAIQIMTNIQECMSIPQIQQVTTQDDQLQ